MSTPGVISVVWLCAGLILLAIGTYPLWRRAIGRLRTRVVEPSDEAQLLIALIERDEGWDKSKQVWFHPAGVCMWIANGRGCLTVNWAAKTKDDYLVITRGGKPLAGADGDAVWAALENTISRSARGVHRNDVFEVARAIERLYSGEAVQ